MLERSKMRDTIRVSLEDFIGTGLFGPLEPGVPRAKVEAWLGPPDNWDGGAYQYQSAAIWKYGDVEFHFDNELLWMIFLDSFGLPGGGSQRDLEPWIISDQLTCAQAEQQLVLAGITYRKEDFPYNENGVRLITSAHVTLSFASADAEEPTLCALHRR